MRTFSLVLMLLSFGCGQVAPSSREYSLFTTRDPEVLTQSTNELPQVQATPTRMILQRSVMRHVDVAELGPETLEAKTEDENKDPVIPESPKAIEEPAGTETVKTVSLLEFLFSFLKRPQPPVTGIIAADKGDTTKIVAEVLPSPITGPISSSQPSPTPSPSPSSTIVSPVALFSPSTGTQPVPLPSSKKQETTGTLLPSPVPKPTASESLVMSRSIKSTQIWGGKTLPFHYDFESDGDVPVLPQSATSPVQDVGYLYMHTEKVSVKALTSILWVPDKPLAKGTLFLWPGLQPAGPTAYSEMPNFLPINIGVLQPVLTWGYTCAPGAPGDNPYGEWWISGQYVNTIGKHPGFMGCKGGPGMLVQPKDPLLLKIEKTSGKSTSWNQTVFNFRTRQTVSYSIDLRGQMQRQVIFSIEPYHGAKPRGRVYFSDILLELESPEPEACKVDSRGPFDRHTAPLRSQNGKFCYLEKLSQALE